MGECGRLAMGTFYHEQEVVAMFTVHYVAVELHVPYQVSDQWDVATQHMCHSRSFVIAQHHETLISPFCDVEAVQSFGSPTSM